MHWFNFVTKDFLMLAAMVHVCSRCHFNLYVNVMRNPSLLATIYSLHSSPKAETIKSVIHVKYINKISYIPSYFKIHVSQEFIFSISFMCIPVLKVEWKTVVWFQSILIVKPTCTTNFNMEIVVIQNPWHFKSKLKS